MFLVLVGLRVADAKQPLLQPELICDRAIPIDRPDQQTNADADADADADAACKQGTPKLFCYH